jgi:hypothetical protein
MEELSITQRVFGTIIFSCYLFAPEIAEIQKGKFTKTIVITILSILFATRLDIQYFIANHPQQFMAILLVGTTAALTCTKYTNILKKTGVKRRIKKLNLTIHIYYHKVLTWVYFTQTDKYIEQVEKRSFSSVWNNFRILILSMLIFDHFILKFSRHSFVIFFLYASTFYSLLIFGKIIRIYPLRIYLVTILSPWILCFFMLLICKGTNIQPSFLEVKYFVSYLGLNASDWLGSTIKFCIFGSASLSWMLIFWTIPSVLARFILRIIIETLKFLLIKIPIFSRQKRKEKIRQLSQNFRKRSIAPFKSQDRSL